VKKTQVFEQLDKFVYGEISQGHLSEKQYAEIVALANRVSEMSTELARFESAKMVIALYEKLDKKNVTQPRDDARKLADYALASYDKTLAKGLAIWRMGLSHDPTSDEVLAKEAELDTAYRANLANKAEQARKRNEVIQSK
jgi:hypothetical protein